MRIIFSILLLLLDVSTARPIIKIDRNISHSRNFFPDLTFHGGHHPVNADSWFCGASQAQWTSSHLLVSNTCEEKMPEINQCCAVHDSCYENLVGDQVYCDATFCECLVYAMKRTENLPFTCTELTTSAACKLVRLFGDFVYGEAVEDVMELRAYHPALNQTANKEYNLLYESCTGFRKPLISCAYNHLVCTLKMLPKERYKQEYTDCREQLITCIEESSEFLKMRKRKTCSRQLDIVLEAIKNDAKLSGLPVEYHYPDITTTDEVLTITDENLKEATVYSSSNTELLEDISTTTEENMLEYFIRAEGTNEYLS